MSTISVSQTGLIERLAKLDTGAVSDALDSVGVGGVALGLTALSVGRRIVGRVITVQLGPDDGRSSHRHLCTAAVEASGPGTIIVVAHRGCIDVAGWGGILSLAAVRRGAEGVVIDGACRDIDETRQLSLPLYARCAVPITARGRVVELEWNTAVTIAGISVSPEDLLIADGSGVVVIPQAIAEKVIAKAENIVDRERLIADAVQAGEPVSSVMGKSYEEMLRHPS